MTTETTATTETEELAERYGEAWNSQDLEAIMELHADDCIFQAHAAGSPAAEGKDAVREAFAAYLAQMPDISFATRSLRCGDDYWVLESTMTGTVAQPLEVDDKPVGATGAGVEVDCIDVIEVRDGLIARKDTYLDALTMQQQLESA
jgi:steroid delta-isomerase-like uncharacterized protein